jgi:hypothetical protein
MKSVYKIDTMINDYFFTTQINNKSSQTFYWFKYLLMFARFLKGEREGWGASLKNWSKQSAFTAVANEVVTIFVEQHKTISHNNPM